MSIQRPASYKRTQPTHTLLPQQTRSAAKLLHAIFQANNPDSSHQLANLLLQTGGGKD